MQHKTPKVIAKSSTFFNPTTADKTHTELMAEIEQEIKPERTSEVSYDPFGLITQYGVKPIIESMDEVLEKYDLTKLSQESATQKPIAKVDNQTIPKIIHLHWVGKDMVDRERWKIIQQLQALNPDYKIVLWVQQLKEVNPDGEMVKLAKAAGVSVVDMRDVFAGNTPLWQEHMITMLKGDYGMVCDIDRPIFFYRYGGVNPDTDDEPINPYGELTPKNGIYLAKLPSGDIIAVNTAVVPKNIMMEKVTANIKQNHAETYKEIAPHLNLGYFMGSVSYDDVFYKFNLYKHNSGKYDGIPLRTFTNDYTLNLVKGKISLNITDDDIYPDKNLFKHRRAFAWLDSDKTTVDFGSDVKLAIKQLLTCILHDLRKEPRCLYIDKYHVALNRYNIGDDILKLLIKYFPEELKKVEYLRITRSCSAAESIQQTFAVQPKLFPNIKHDLHYISQLILTDFNFELVKYLYQHSKEYDIPNEFWISLAKDFSGALAPLSMKDSRITNAINIADFFSSQIGPELKIPERTSWLNLLCSSDGQFSLGLLAVINHLVNKSENINIKSENDETLLTLLLKLYTPKDNEILQIAFMHLIQELIKNGADIKAQNSQGETVIALAKVWAEKHNHPEFLEQIFLQENIDIDAMAEYLANENEDEIKSEIKQLTHDVNKLKLLEKTFDIVLNDISKNEEERNQRLLFLKQTYMSILENCMREAFILGLIELDTEAKSYLDYQIRVVDKTNAELVVIFEGGFMDEDDPRSKMQTVKNLNIKVFDDMQHAEIRLEKTSQPSMITSEHIIKPTILKHWIGVKPKAYNRTANEQLNLDDWFQQQEKSVNRTGK